MNTNKLFRFMMMLFLVVGATFAFSGCSDDDESGNLGGAGGESESLSGVYAYYYQDESRNGILVKRGQAIWFEKGKCHYTGLTDNTNRSLYADWVRWAPLPGYSGWYFEDDQNHNVYSYEVEGSNIYLSNGDVLTKEGDIVWYGRTKYTKL